MARTSLSKLAFSRCSVNAPTTTANSSRITNVSAAETSASLTWIGSRRRVRLMAPRARPLTARGLST